jgi:hypothetical protein
MLMSPTARLSAPGPAVAHALLRRAYQTADSKPAQRLLRDPAKRLEPEYPSAAGSVREGLDEALTGLTLKLSPRLRRSLAPANAVESLIRRTRLVTRNVKRWRGGQISCDPLSGCGAARRPPVGLRVGGSNIPIAQSR